MEKQERKPRFCVNNFLFRYDANRFKENKGHLLVNKITNALESKGLNKSAFAHLMDVQPSVVTKWLSGNHNFTIDTLFEIERKLNIDLLAIPNTDLTQTIKMQTTAHGNVPVAYKSNLELVTVNDSDDIKYARPLDFPSVQI